MQLDKQFYDLTGKLYDVGVTFIRASPPGSSQPEYFLWWSKCDNEGKRRVVQKLQTQVDKVKLYVLSVEGFTNGFLHSIESQASPFSELQSP